jgi:predicted ATPase
MLIRRIRARDADPEVWPYTVPAVREIADRGLEFTAPVTMLVGENGSGKSTIAEAIAEAYGINPRGGRGKPHRRASNARSPLARAIEFEFTDLGMRLYNGKKRSRSYFLRAETAFDFLEFVSSTNLIVPGYPQEDLRVLSHGEGYLAVFRAVFNEPGLYLMDEPEAALSFTACLQLVAAMYEIGQLGAQVICATHSPILAATPGAEILELDDTGITRTTWNDLLLVDHWRRYLTDPKAYLRHLITEPE